MSHGTEDNIYFAADNIYPEFPIFMQSCGESIDPKVYHYSKRLEAVRKDIERAFGILQARFAFLTKPCLLWYVEDIASAVECCIILHNMIVEEESDSLSFDDDDSNIDLYIPTSFPSQPSHSRTTPDILDLYIQNTRELQSYHKFKTFRTHLINHLYSLKKNIINSGTDRLHQ
tara:strand:- start:173 stop:691 length:519 start_codon:yes stop_codon:yes gene_type:complete